MTSGAVSTAARSLPIKFGTFIGALALSQLGIPALQNYVAQDSFNVIPNELLPVQALVVLRRREIIPNDQYRAEMRRLGFEADRADAVLLSQDFFPTPQDLVSWMAKEVFEPDAVEKYGLADEFDKLDLASFAKAGVDNVQARNFWMAHWQHPSFLQVADMLHRDVLTDPEDRDRVEPGSPEWDTVRSKGFQEMFEWFRLVEVPPHWRDRMRKIADTIFTRVDIRRMWDMRMVTDQEVLRQALDMGLPIVEARKLVTWVKVFTDFPDLMARYSNGWISPEDVVSRLIGFGMPPERAQELLETRMDNLARPQRVARERDLTKAEIVKGVKKNVIGLATGEALLMDLGYDADEASFVMAINIEAGDTPETPLEFKQLTQGYRRSVGLSSSPVAPGALVAEKRLTKAQNDLDAAIDGFAPEGDVLVLRAEVSQAKAVLDSELAAMESLRVQSEKPPQDSAQ